MKNPLGPGDPRRLGDYELLSRLGQGGMGTVYLAREPSGRLVAVKVIRPEFAYEAEFRGRFRSEVNRARQVPPFCTAEVLYADPDHRTPYLVVEYVDGPSLAEVVEEKGPLGAGSLYSVAIGVATALTAIHGAGVIHRDLKPRNVLFSLGTPKVIDFGIARALEVTSQHTGTDQMVGTVAYMAPERFDAESRTVTPAADVFAWGAVVVFAATGRTPFHADSPAATAARILTQPPNLSGLPGPLRDLVALTLDKDPAQRPTAYELLDLLLAAGSPGAPAGLDADLAHRPELRRAAEAAQHSGRYVTGDPRRPAMAPVRPLGRGGRAARLLAAGAGAAVLAAAGLAMAVIGADWQAADGGAGPVAESPSPSAPVPPVTRVVRGPSVIDRLDRPGQWRSSGNEGSGGCRFDGRLVASTGDSGAVQCRGPSDTFAGDQSIAVDVTSLAPGSCALVWFRFISDSGYRLSACAGGLDLELLDAGEAATLKTWPSEVFRDGDRHRLGIDIRGQRATVTVDGAPVIEADVNEPTLVAGRVVFGVSTEDLDSEGRVGFANAEIRSR
ncbi:serine/threonine-protein kinase [Jidongwangia harbinensis]|uniref:serine/threonine-protein kinase n=1 Tax=Jidongwangia harbinensis TaxID=2878561 RepID=UPI001CDA02BA|nr:serine/threonine-protein kinase [Jidongwangia harbinensis]MCA2214268.1 serine/threonine protein kinase [Jidongwangia harbinensis]